MSAVSAASNAVTAAEQFAADYCQLLTVRYFFRLIIGRTNVYLTSGPNKKYRIYINDYDTGLFTVFLGVETPGSVNRTSTETYYIYDHASCIFITQYFKQRVLKYMEVYNVIPKKPVMISNTFEYRKWAFTDLGVLGLKSVDQTTAAIISNIQNEGSIEEMKNQYPTRLERYAVIYGGRLIETYKKYSEQPSFYNRRMTRPLEVLFDSNGMARFLRFVGTTELVQTGEIGPSDILTIAVLFSEGHIDRIRPAVHKFIDAGTDFTPTFQGQGVQIIEGTDFFSTDEEDAEQELDETQYQEDSNQMNVSMGNSTGWGMDDDEEMVTTVQTLAQNMSLGDDGQEMVITVPTVDLNMPFGDNQREDSFGQIQL